MMKDDNQYMELMDKYKVARRDPDQREAADLYLRAAMELRERGNVSQDVIIGAAYM
jgi:hypothetical protein